MKRVVVLVVLLTAVMGMAYLIESKARPETGRVGQKVEAGHSD